MTALDVLKKYWGHEAFRHPQQEVIDAFLAGRDVLAILPTGAGKSVCFQVSALLKPGLCLVVTPLIALMQDQVQALRRRGIDALAIHAGLNRAEIDIALDHAVYGKQKFLYVSPERLQTEIFKERFKKMNVNLIAVDEAHCISQWGYDFRPPYLVIHELRDLQPGVPFMALTASATAQVATDIVDKLSLKKPATFQVSFARENLSLVVRKTEAKEKQMLEILRKVPGAAIVYVRSRKATEAQAKLLTRQRIGATFYHAGLPADERTRRQRAWLDNEVRVIVATNAFGMGIDKPDVRTVIHLDLPENLESYYQEAGRAGRDGRRSYATVVFHEADARALRAKTELAQPNLDDLRKIYQALANYYQLALGSGQGEAFDFDLDAFAKRFGLKGAAAHAALKKLEEFGLIELNEAFHRPSRIHFSADQKQLYEFQVANARFDPLIKLLLRLHGAVLFSDFVVFSENQLAHALKTTLPDVRQALQKLHDQHLLVYEAASDSPQVVFVLPRQDARHLPIDHAELTRRRQLHLDKMEAMIAYATQESQCRMQRIQAYFDEPTYARCGICDLCLQRKKTDHLAILNDYTGQVNYLLHQKPMGVEELEQAVSPRDKDLFIEAVRELVDAGTIAYDDHWVLHKK